MDGARSWWAALWDFAMKAAPKTTPNDMPKQRPRTIWSTIDLNTMPIDEPNEMPRGSAALELAEARLDD